MYRVKIALLVVITKFLLGLPLHAQDKTLLNGTLIITLVSNDTIWLGADSRTSSLTNKGYTVNKTGMCKIYNNDNVVFAMAGHVRYVDNSFDFIKLMRACINDKKDFEEAMKVFQQRTKKEIRSILTKFSRRSINTLIKTNKGSFLSVVAVSFVNDEKQIKEMKFSIEAAVNNNWSVNYTEASGIDVGSLRFVGHAVNASRYVRNNNLYFGNGRNVGEKINDLIKLESEQGTVTVGLPADVISIYNGGYKKVITSGLCEE
jgi:hypothetical protein